MRQDDPQEICGCVDTSLTLSAYRYFKFVEDLENDLVDIMLPEVRGHMRAFEVPLINKLLWSEGRTVQRLFNTGSFTNVTTVR